MSFKVWPLGMAETSAAKISAEGPGEAATLYANSTWVRDTGDGPLTLLVRDPKKKLVIVKVDCIVSRNYVCNLSYEIKE